MLSRRLYYSLKPFTPWKLRMGVRRVLARRLRKKNAATWPIDPSAGRTPDAWPGWPHAKDFAFVLTHDVEGPLGLSKVRTLAELEMKLGYRSTFNFIPEGPYKVPPELRAWLTDHGFEVGVHDLKHDGRLFSSRSRFEPLAQRINQHARSWKARGFRAGFMLRNLDWLHRLDVSYDASTFDTDPFEFQSEGTGTIFPFWVPAGNDHPYRSVSPVPNQNGGYVEMPYTLPQDSTLFLLLRETGPDIWLKKLDWVAEKGGMALVNVHPDYVQFEGDAPTARTFPVAHYVRLLEYTKQRYGHLAWQAVAGDVADFAARLKTRQPTRHKTVCMVTHSFYENDNRVLRYATALAARGDHVDVLALRRSANVPVHEEIDGVSVHRIISREGKQERSKFAYFSSWFRFLLHSARWVRAEHRKRPYDVIHVHNMPDFLVFAAWQPQRAGARVILDIHDIVPEFYASKFGAPKRSLTGFVLEFAERLSARHADHVIISNHLWLERYTRRTGTKERCSVFINNVNTQVFQPHPRNRNDGKRIIIFPGGLQWHQGLDIALRAFSRVARELPDTEFHIYGDGNMKPSLIKLTADLGLNDRVRFLEPIGVKDIARVMADADLGVVPKRADSFGNEAYSTKIMEFMSVGVPVVVSSTKIDRFYFDDTVVRFFESGNHEALAGAMLEVLGNPELRDSMIGKAMAYSHQHSWEVRKDDYFQIVDSLVGDYSTSQLEKKPAPTPTPIEATPV